ncbi:Hypothetical predicted protein [Octopus vulgaris]|uniref:Uncharacterized protein n=2 Tax=Octopus TaxID=6643 RepID=A0AA36BI58_OCTVU|nr:uncharacterized protein LOC115220432 [Octopus sinensis]CAI9734142.1 Hypothetical predicted protein [Octopus vulgaris]
MHPIATLILSSEVFHAMTHSMVLFRLRLLPRKDLVQVNYYFVFDLLSVFFASFLVLQRLQWLACIQMAQHLYYIVFWNKTSLAKKIISWSSLDWIKSKYNEKWEFDNILGTAFDLAVHISFSYLLSKTLTFTEIVVGVAMASFLLNYVMFSKKFAWSNPQNIPAWVQKRIQPLGPWWN